VGNLDLVALALPPSPSLADVERQAAAAAGFTVPSGRVAAEASTTKAVDTIEKLDETDEESDKQREEAADLAARLVASTISIPSASDNEVFQVVREYPASTPPSTSSTTPARARPHRPVRQPHRPGYPRHGRAGTSAQRLVHPGPR
jgi:hypothetical protein